MFLSFYHLFISVICFCHLVIEVSMMYNNIGAKIHIKVFTHFQYDVTRVFQVSTLSFLISYIFLLPSSTLLCGAVMRWIWWILPVSNPYLRQRAVLDILNENNSGSILVLVALDSSNSICRWTCYIDENSRFDS